MSVWVDRHIRNQRLRSVGVSEREGGLVCCEGVVGLPFSPFFLLLLFGFSFCFSLVSASFFPLSSL